MLMSTTGSRDSIYFRCLHNISLSEMLTEYTHQLVVLLIALPYTLLADLMICNSIQKNVFYFYHILDLHNRMVSLKLLHLS